MNGARTNLISLFFAQRLDSATLLQQFSRELALLTHTEEAVPNNFSYPDWEVGSWWSRQAQIDIVAVNRAERRVIFGEAKWQRATVTTEDVKRLINRGLRWLDGDAYWDVHYALFVRAVDSVNESVTNDRRIHIYTPDDIIGR